MRDEWLRMAVRVACKSRTTTRKRKRKRKEEEGKQLKWRVDDMEET